MTCVHKKSPNEIRKDQVSPHPFPDPHPHPYPTNTRRLCSCPWLLNLRTDVEDRMRIARASERQSILRENVILSKGGDEIPEDLIPIEIDLYNNFTFEGTPEGGSANLHFKGEIEFAQGRMKTCLGQDFKLHSIKGSCRCT